MFSIGRHALRMLRRAGAWVNAGLTELLRDKDMPPNAGEGIQVTKEGMLYVDFEDIQKSAGYQEAVRRGDQVLSVEYRPLHATKKQMKGAPHWVIHCAETSSGRGSLSIPLPPGLADCLGVIEGDALVVTKRRSGVVEMCRSARKPSESG